MFLPIQGGLARSHMSSSLYELLGQHKGIDNSDYSDRYFQFSVPPTDLPDALLERQLIDLRRQPNEASSLQQVVATRPALVVRKLEYRELC